MIKNIVKAIYIVFAFIFIFIFILPILPIAWLLIVIDAMASCIKDVFEEEQ